PAAERARGRPFDDGVAVAVEADGLARRQSHRLVEVDAGALEDADELRMGAEADAAARQLILVALEHHGVPAGAAQQMRRDQPAERATDDQRAPHLFPRAVTSVTTSPRTCRRGRACNPCWWPPDCG